MPEHTSSYTSGISDKPLLGLTIGGMFDAFPMTVTGKVQKFLMQEESVKELGLEKAAAIKMA